MVTVSFTIGSFGDITSILQHTSAIRALLVEAASAAVEVKQVVEDVESFSQSLQQIKAVIESRHDGLNADIRNGIEHALSICDSVLRAVEVQLSSYRQGLMRKHGPSWRKYWTMVAWSALGGRKSAESLKQRLSEQIHAVHTFLALSQSHDQARLLNLATEQGTIITRVYEVAEDMSKRFDFGIPSFKFHDPFDGQYYLPMGRTSLQKLLEVYEWFTTERTCIVDFPDNETHRTMLIPIGFRYTATLDHPAYAMVDCLIFRDAAFGQPQVLMSAPWVVSRRRNLDSAHTPFYERIPIRRCSPRPGSDIVAHMHFRACEQILMRQDITFDEFWENRRDKSLIELMCYYGEQHPEKPVNLVDKMEEPEEKWKRFIKGMCWEMFPSPGSTADRDVCIAISPIVRLRQKADCEVLPSALQKKATALLSKEFLQKVDKYSAIFDAEKGSELVWMCWAEELRRAILNTS